MVVTSSTSRARGATGDGCRRSRRAPRRACVASLARFEAASPGFVIRVMGADDSGCKAGLTAGPCQATFLLSSTLYTKKVIVMLWRRSAWIVLVALAVATVVGAAAVAQSVREHSLEPIWTIGWIPAVLVASLARPRTTAQCRRRMHRRSRS